MAWGMLHRKRVRQTTTVKQRNSSKRNITKAQVSRVGIRGTRNRPKAPKQY